MLTRTDAQVDFPTIADQDANGDFQSGVGVDTFSARWEGYVLLDYNEVYTFYGTANDGQRLWVDGQLLIDQWELGISQDPACSNEEACATFDVTAQSTGADWYPIVYEFFDNNGPAMAKLSFSSASESMKVIPTDHLSVMLDGADITPPTIETSYIKSLSPNMATVYVAASETSTATVYYGSQVPTSGDPTDFASNKVSVDSNGDVLSAYNHSVVLRNVPSGTFYYQVVITDTGTNKTTGSVVTACAPSENDVTAGSLRAKYYTGSAFDTLRLAKTDTSIDFNESNLSADVMTALGQSTNNFSVRWQGLYQANPAGVTSFRGTSNDGQRLYVDGVRVINDWSTRAVARSVIQSADLTTGGWRAFSYEVFQDAGDMQAKVERSVGASAYSIIADSQFGYLDHKFVGPRFQDSSLPEITQQAVGMSLTEVNLTTPAIYDCRDPGPTVTNNAPAGGFAIGTHQVTWTATNRFGEKTDLTQTVRITDSAPPTIAAMDNLELTCDSPTGDGKTPKARLSLHTPVVTDNADPSPSWVDNAPAIFNVSGSCLTNDDCSAEQVCNSSWAKCSDTGAACSSDADCSAGRCQTAPTCVTRVQVTATDMGGLSSSASYDVAVVNSSQLVLDVGPTQLEVLNATGLNLDAERRCAVPSEVLNNPATYIKDYDSTTMTLSSEGTWVAFRMPQVRGLCSAGSEQFSVDHNYPKTKTSNFISSETQSAEQLLTLCLPHNTNNSNGAPDQLVSQITWDVLENGVPRGVDCASLGVGEVCPRTVNVAVYNTGYLVMLTDYTGKRAEDDVYTAAGSSDLYPFVKSHVCNPTETMCGSSLVNAHNWGNYLQSSSQSIAWKIAHSDSNYTPVWDEQDDAAASWHANLLQRTSIARSPLRRKSQPRAVL